MGGTYRSPGIAALSSIRTMLQILCAAGFSLIKCDGVTLNPVQSTTSESIYISIYYLLLVNVCANVRPLIGHHEHLHHPKKSLRSRPFSLHYPFLGKLGESNKTTRGLSPSGHQFCQVWDITVQNQTELPLRNLKKLCAYGLVPSFSRNRQLRTEIEGK